MIDTTAYQALLLDLSVSLLAGGQTWTTNGSEGDVQAKINGAVDGDTVIIPTGTFQWVNGVTCSKSIKIAGSGYTPNSSINNTNPGAPALSTVINYTGTQFAFGITSASVGGVFRLSGINFRGLIGGNAGYLFISSSPTADPWRVDNCLMDGGNQQAIMFGIIGLCLGSVCDHCTFIGGAASEMVHNLGVGAGNDAGWRDDITPGSNQLIYFEDCLWSMFNYQNQTYQTGTSGMQSYYGARNSVRYSTFQMAQIDQHGSVPPNYGTRWFEFYNLKFIQGAASIANVSGMSNFALRGGSGFVYNITNPPSTGGYGCGLYSDQTTPCTCGPGNGIAPGGVFHVPDNSSPVYLWGLSADMGVGTQNGVNGANDIAANRNFFVSANIPANMTVWQKASGAQANYVYTPFTYPHPLIALTPGGGGSGGGGGGGGGGQQGATSGNNPFMPVSFRSGPPTAMTWEDGPGAYVNASGTPIRYNGQTQTSRINATNPVSPDIPGKNVLPGAAIGMSQLPGSSGGGGGGGGGGGAPGSYTLGDTNIEPNSTGLGIGVLYGVPITVTNASRLQSISLYSSSVGTSTHARFGVYRGTALIPTTLVAEMDGSPILLLTGVPGWITMSLATPVSLSPGIYWLVYQMDTNTLDARYTAAASPAFYYVNGNAAVPLPANMITGGTQTTVLISVYATLITP